VVASLGLCLRAMLHDRTRACRPDRL